MQHISVPLAQILSSLELIRRGVINHDRCEPEDFDHAVRTLAESHDQLGGDTRRLLYALFAASHHHADDDALNRAIRDLTERLERHEPATNAEQLRLFPPDETARR